MTRTSSLQILMATYNGHRFIARQLDSILEQSVTNWTLLIRDDGSTDGTTEIIRAYRDMHAGKIIVIEDGLGNLGPKGNFARLLESADADYIMFSDQDDVWLPNKIELSVSGMKKLEEASGITRPLLLHTDLVVTDSALRPIAASFWKYQKMNPGRGVRFQRLLIENVANGCTVIINKKLKDMASPIPPEAIMHDWWLALVAASFGKIDYLHDQTVLYRQHSRNEVGARAWNLSYLSGKLMQLLDSRQLHESLTRSGKQAELFLALFGEKLSLRNSQQTLAYSGLLAQGPIKKRCLVLRHGFLRSGLIRNISLLARI